MSWTAPVDIYCERLSPAFWAEPLNAISNLAFLIAALIAFGAARRRGRLEPPVMALIALAAAVGVGSFLFHTFAARWAGLADTAPILLFILVYLYLAARRYLGLPALAALGAPLPFIAFSFGFLSLWRMGAPSLNGSEGYLPVLVALAGFGAALRLRRHPAAPALFLAAAVFAASLVCRSLDQAACDVWPSGLHFIWHCLNGALLAIVMLAFINHGAPVGVRLARRPSRG